MASTVTQARGHWERREESVEITSCQKFGAWLCGEFVKKAARPFIAKERAFCKY
jgi:hypothetical protein